MKAKISITLTVLLFSINTQKASGQSIIPKGEIWVLLTANFYADSVRIFINDSLYFSGRVTKSTHDPALYLKYKVNIPQAHIVLQYFQNRSVIYCPHLNGGRFLDRVIIGERAIFYPMKQVKLTVPVSCNGIVFEAHVTECNNAPLTRDVIYMGKRCFVYEDSCIEYSVSNIVPILD
jgi:hypothetical protein